MRRAAAVLVLAVAVAVVAVAIAGATGRPPSVEQRADAIAERLRCPSCQGTSVAGSSSPMARDIRDKILADLRAGRSEDDITGDFVRMYGDGALLTPPPRGLGLTPWLGALLATLATVAAGLVTMRRWLHREDR